MDVAIREEASIDTSSIHALNAAAFETDAEARLFEPVRSLGFGRH